MKKSLISLTLLSLLCGCNSDVGTVAEMGSATVTVNTVIAQSKTQQFIESHSSLIQPAEQVEVISRTQGYLIKTHAKAGDSVKKGQLLYELDAVDYEISKAELDSQLAIANTHLQMAQREYARAQQLKESLSLQELDEVETNFKLAQGQVALLERQIDRVQLDISRTKIRAPINGVIGERSFDEGALINAGQVLNDIVNDEQVEVILNLDEKKLLAIIDDLRQGNADFSARLQLIDGTTLSEEGQVSSIDNKVNPNTGSLAIKVQFTNQGQLYSGQYAQLLVVRSADSMLLPQQAIINAPDGNYVYTVVEGKVARQDVTTGTALKDKRVVFGVAEGAQVITHGHSRLSVGEPVQIEG
ncbi:efflux RND transporter periplasmic adaptor subunit [Paraferrimonas haliotis]|uniref:RND transporter n=1 Tax=Paraferrimonas haliotis TaxID=2013866 RepID=A0AA37WY68_9GAMM|nr:efflux RND transporter periplasmic adaptor subunit [Paraferrimonas haliotis]GLS83375.1 RND transporter [Paraferrimonas haliotis]